MCETEIRILKFVASISMFTQKPKETDNWKENSLNGPPEQQEDEMEGRVTLKIAELAYLGITY